MGPLLKSVKVSLDGTPSLQGINCTSQLSATCKLVKGALNPTTSTNKGIKNNINTKVFSLQTPEGHHNHVLLNGIEGK